MTSVGVSLFNYGLLYLSSRILTTDASSNQMGTSIKFAKRKQVGDGRIGVIDVTAV